MLALYDGEKKSREYQKIAKNKIIGIYRQLIHETCECFIDYAISSYLCHESIRMKKYRLAKINSNSQSKETLTLEKYNEQNIEIMRLHQRLFLVLFNSLVSCRYAFSGELEIIKEEAEAFNYPEFDEEMLLGDSGKIHFVNAATVLVLNRTHDVLEDYENRLSDDLLIAFKDNAIDLEEYKNSQNGILTEKLKIALEMEEYIIWGTPEGSYYTTPLE